MSLPLSNQGQHHMPTVEHKWQKQHRQMLTAITPRTLDIFVQQKSPIFFLPSDNNENQETKKVVKLQQTHKENKLTAIYLRNATKRRMSKKRKKGQIQKPQLRKKPATTFISTRQTCTFVYVAFSGFRRNDKMSNIKGMFYHLKIVFSLLRQMSTKGGENLKRITVKGNLLKLAIILY